MLRHMYLPMAVFQITGSENRLLQNLLVQVHKTYATYRYKQCVRYKMQMV